MRISDWSSDVCSSDLIGRMTAGFQRDKVIEHVEEALAAGARLRFGRIPDRESLLVQPMIIDQVTPDMRLWRDETFGPVLPVMRFADEADAFRLRSDERRVGRVWVGTCRSRG